MSKKTGIKRAALQRLSHSMNSIIASTDAKRRKFTESSNKNKPCKKIKLKTDPVSSFLQFSPESEYKLNSDIILSNSKKTIPSFEKKSWAPPLKINCSDSFGYANKWNVGNTERINVVCNKTKQEINKFNISAKTATVTNDANSSNNENVTIGFMDNEISSKTNISKRNYNLTGHIIKHNDKNNKTNFFKICASDDNILKPSEEDIVNDTQPISQKYVVSKEVVFIDLNNNNSESESGRKDELNLTQSSADIINVKKSIFSNSDTESDIELDLDLNSSAVELINAPSQRDQLKKVDEIKRNSKNKILNESQNKSIEIHEDKPDFTDNEELLFSEDLTDNHDEGGQNILTTGLTIQEDDSYEIANAKTQEVEFVIDDDDCNSSENLNNSKNCSIAEKVSLNEEKISQNDTIVTNEIFIDNINCSKTEFTCTDETQIVTSQSSTQIIVEFHEENVTDDLLEEEEEENSTSTHVKERKSVSINDFLETDEDNKNVERSKDVLINDFLQTDDNNKSVEHNKDLPTNVSNISLEIIEDVISIGMTEEDSSQILKVNSNLSYSNTKPDKSTTQNSNVETDCDPSSGKENSINMNISQKIKENNHENLCQDEIISVHSDLTNSQDVLSVEPVSNMNCEDSKTPCDNIVMKQEKYEDLIECSDDFYNLPMSEFIRIENEYTETEMNTKLNIKNVNTKQNESTNNQNNNKTKDSNQSSSDNVNKQSFVNLTNCQMPKLDWIQKMKEEKQKIRAIIQEISQLNAIVLQARKELWPHQFNTSLKPPF